MLSASAAERILVSPLCITTWTVVDSKRKKSSNNRDFCGYFQCPQILFKPHLFCVHSCVMFSDETPTPTRFLQNCEEVGVFREIEEEFLQAQEEENIKQVNVTEKIINLAFVRHFSQSGLKFKGFLTNSQDTIRFVCEVCRVGVLSDACL